MFKPEPKYSVPERIIQAGQRSSPCAPASLLKTPFYQRWRRTDNGFVNASLVSSYAILQRASMWSFRTGREGTHIMNFAFSWRSTLCSVEQWYQTQLQHSQETGSTTRFSAIQHRRTLESPYFHEFLLILLRDGSFYRLERTGRGSDISAITLSGCAAYDLVEWFPSEQYHAYVRDKPSDLVAEVQFPHDFDILDVLAVCYSIQKQPRARKYSLQYFNCYFFCCTILSILSRRLFDLEGIAAPDCWDGLIDQVFSKISALCVTPLTAEGRKYSALQFCAALDFENPSPGWQIVDGLQYLLRTESTASELSEKALADTLWIYNIRESLRTNLTRMMEPVAKRLRYQLFEKALEVAHHPQQQPADYGRMAKIFMPDHSACVSEICSRAREIRFLVTHGNRSVSAGTRVVAKLCGPPVGFALGTFGMLIMLVGPVAPRSLGVLDRLKLGYMNAHGFSKLSSPLIASAVQPDTSEPEHDFREKVCLLMDMRNNDFINTAFGTFASKVLVPPGTLNTYLAQTAHTLARHSFHWGGLEYSIGALLWDSLGSLVKTKALTDGSVITFVKSGEPCQGGTKLNLLEFQNHVLEHIKAYAARVEENHLGSSVSVCYDVETAISYVWRSMPEGFGVKRYRMGNVSDN